MRAKLGREQNVPHLPTGTLYSPQFCSHQEAKMADQRLNDRHLRSHGKIGDFEQSSFDDC